MVTSTIFQFLLDGFLIGGIYAAFAVGFSLIFGVIRIVNIVHGEFIMLGAFITYWLFNIYGIDPFVTIPISFVILFGVGYMMQRYIINRVVDIEIMTLLLTFGLSLIIANTALMIWKPDYRMVSPAYAASNFEFMGLTVSVVRLITFVIAIITVTCLWLFLQRTDTGRAIRAASQNRDRAMSLGVNIEHIYAFTYGLGAAIAGIAGSILGMSFVIFPAMGGEYLLLSFSIVVLGGMGYIPGALFGGILLGVLTSAFTNYFSAGIMYVLIFGLIYLILVIRPTGLFGKGVKE
jgi:branched-chain amino acid transport system permease protein